MSGSFRRSGENSVSVIRARRRRAWSEEIPQGLFGPVSCRNSKGTIVRATIPNGRMKCRVKNRIRVGLSMAGPPQPH